MDLVRPFTHLLHVALRVTLGDEVKELQRHKMHQIVNTKSLRFAVYQNLETNRGSKQQNRTEYRGCKSLARKCEKTAHPVTMADRRSALCLKSPLESVLSPSIHHNSKTIELLAYRLTIH